MKIIKDLDLEIDKFKTSENEKRRNYEKLASEIQKNTEDLKSLKGEFAIKEAENKTKKNEIERKRLVYEEKTHFFKKLQEELKRFVN